MAVSLKNNLEGHRGELSAKLLYSIEHVKNSRGAEHSSMILRSTTASQWTEVKIQLMACFQTCDCTYNKSICSIRDQIFTSNIFAWFVACNNLCRIPLYVFFLHSLQILSFLTQSYVALKKGIWGDWRIKWIF